MSKVNSLDQINEIAQWVEDHEGDVDTGSFLDACDGAAITAAHEHMMRVPRGIFGRGLTTLDFACALNRRGLPSGLLAYQLKGTNEIFDAVEWSW